MRERDRLRQTFFIVYIIVPCQTLKNLALKFSKQCKAFPNDCLQMLAKRSNICSFLSR